MTTFQEFHKWEGISWAGGRLAFVITLGWVTVGFSPYRISQKLAELTESLKGITKP